MNVPAGKFMSVVDNEETSMPGGYQATKEQPAETYDVEKNIQGNGGNSDALATKERLQRVIGNAEEAYKVAFPRNADSSVCRIVAPHKSARSPSQTQLNHLPSSENSENVSLETVASSVPSSCNGSSLHDSFSGLHHSKGAADEFVQFFEVQHQESSSSHDSSEPIQDQSGEPCRRGNIFFFVLVALMMSIAVVSSVKLNAVNVDSNSFLRSPEATITPNLSSPTPSAATITTAEKTTVTSTSAQETTTKSISTAAKCARFVTPLFEKGCGYCSPSFAIDGNTAVASRHHDTIQFFSIRDGNFELEATFKIDYDVYDIALFDNVAVVGSPYEDIVGAVHIFEQSSSGWEETMRIAPDDVIVEQTMFGNKPVGFGNSVSIHGDAFVVGALWRNSAYIYRRSGSKWVKETKLVPEQGASNFGISVSVQGNMVAVGDHVGRNVFSGEGQVFVFYFDVVSKSWKQYGDPILKSDDCKTYFGAGVAFDSNNGLFIGCSNENGLDKAGAVYYYIHSENDKEFIFNQKIMASDAADGEHFGGWNDRIAVDGDILVVGSNMELHGKASIFKRDNGVWKELSKIYAPEYSGAYFGAAAISRNKVLVGSYTNVYGYELDLEYC